MSTTIEIRQGRWGSEKPVTFHVPDSVRVTEAAPKQAVSLSQLQIDEEVRLALEKENGDGIWAHGTSVALVIDDLWRPTPVEPILSSALRFLRGRGLNDSDMRLVIACGTHVRPSESQIAAKIGRSAQGIRVVVHDCRFGNAYICRTAAGTPLSVNSAVLSARTRILIGGVYPHPNAGFSGGEKLLVPGVCGLPAIEYLHEMIPGADRRAGSTDTEFRKEIVRCTERIGSSILINACLNARGEISALFCGQPAEAFARAEKYARHQNRVELLPPDTDIVIVEAFPFDMSFNLISDRALWPLAFHLKAKQLVVVGECPQGRGSHELDYSPATRVRRRLRQFFRRNFKGMPQLAATLVRRACKQQRLPAFTLVSGAFKNIRDGELPRSVRVVHDGQSLVNGWKKLFEQTSCTLGIYRAAGLTYYGG